MSNKRIRSNAFLKRDCHHPELEKELYEFVLETRKKGGCVGQKILKSKALELAKKKNIEKFSVSVGWLFKFLQRKKLSLRRITSTGRNLPSNFKVTYFPKIRLK